MKRARVLSAAWPRLVCGLAALAYLEGVRTLAGAPFEVTGALLRWLAVQGALEISLQVGEVQWQGRRWTFGWPFVILLALLAAAVALYAGTAHTAAAWAVVVTFSGLVVALSSAWSECRWTLRLPGWGLLAGVGGVAPVLVEQIESSFSEEEFFAAAQAVALAGLVALWIVARWWISIVAGGERTDDPRAPRGFSLPWPGIAAGSVLLGTLFLEGTAWAYRHSFYPVQAPAYEGVSAESPFVCGPGKADGTAPGSEPTFQRLVERVAANPDKGASEYGMLALATGEDRWAGAFRRALLDDAGSGAYTDPAHSVKSAQHFAAQRVYYYGRVLASYPDLFTPPEQTAIEAWFSDVNRRALTVEWVDWMYALAFSYWPRGPYQNQESGAGLLAQLEVHGLGDAALSPRNRSYLANNQGGWLKRFRNTDDAYIYQAEWIDNALSQALYWHESVGVRSELLSQQALSYDWLMLQALSDGASLGYNHPNRVPLAGVAYMGANLVGDARYVWWSARMLDWMERADVALYAQPGAERAAPVDGRSPDVGSCLMFGGSGLPNQVGPLAPDKVVFREGWQPDSAYVLLNLRFTGWHRYKATNTVTLVYQAGPLSGDVLGGPTGSQALAWLPAGRSLNRDKRIPREHLNGLLVERTGVGATLALLTGIGSPWAQDPPPYAEVVAFETGDDLDWAHTRLADWRGWQHDRWIHFYRDGGPIVVVDEAAGPAASEAALAWHLIGEGILEGGRIMLRDPARAGMLRDSDDPAEMVLLLTGTGGSIESTNEGASDTGPSVWVRSPASGHLRVATVFLLGEWVGAEVEYDAKAETLRIARGSQALTVPLRRGA